MSILEDPFRSFQSSGFSDSRLLFHPCIWFFFSCKGYLLPGDSVLITQGFWSLFYKLESVKVIQVTHNIKMLTMLKRIIEF